MNSKYKKYITLLCALVFGASAAVFGDDKSGNISEPAVIPQLPEESFSSIIVSGGELIADGTAQGTEYGGISLDSGSQLTFTDGGATYTLSEAEEKLGVRVMRNTQGDEVIVSPFSTARLIVRADSVPDSSDASEVTEPAEGLYLLSYGTIAEAYAAYQKFTADSGIIYAEPDSVCAALEDEGEIKLVKEYHYTEDDLGGWGVEAIGARDFCRELEENGGELPQVVVAIVDTGVNYDHIFLKDRLVSYGANFSGVTDRTANDKHGHGSHCAGIVCSATPENVRILPVKALDDRGNGSVFSVYSGIRYAVDQGADVISLSLGLTGRSNLLEEAVEYAEKANVAVCVAAGNEYRSDLVKAGSTLPVIDHTVTVGSLNRNFECSGFSNWGPIDFSAPGEKILSCYAGDPDRCEKLSGTSMATPFVAACFADMFTWDPDLTVQEAYDHLKANTLDVCAEGYDKQSGWGMVNLRNFRFSGERMEAPTANYQQGCYDYPITVSLSCARENAAIYYTTDGTIPTAEKGILYDGEGIEIAETTTLRAVAVLDGIMSRYEEFKYYINDFDPENITIDSNGVLWEYDSYDVKLDLKRLVESGRIPPFTAVGDMAFQRCGNLEEIILPDEVSIIGKYAFSSCIRLRSVTMNAEIIMNEAFSYCADLTEVNDSSITRVMDGAFSSCSRLEKFDGTKLTAIANRAFYSCNSIGLDSFDPSLIESYGYDCFANSGIRGRLDASRAETIGPRAFENTHLTEVILADTVETIPDRAFKGCSSLRYISAKGLKNVESGGLALGKSEHTPLTEVHSDIDFSALVSVRPNAFEGYVFHGDVCFLSLDNYSTLEGFCGAYGSRLTFPNMDKLVVDPVISGIYADAIELPRLTSFGSRTPLGGCGAVVIGSPENEVKLSEIKDTAFDKNVKLFTYGEQGDVRKLAEMCGCEYSEVPAIYCPKEHYILGRGQDCNITAYAFGDDLQGEWLTENGDGIIKLDTDGNMLLVHHSSDYGSTVYIYRVTDGSGNVTEARIIVDVTEDELPVFDIEENGFDLIGDTEFYECGHKGIELDNGYTLYRGRFTAETGGKYIIDTNRVKVNCSCDGQLLFTAGTDSACFTYAEFEAGKTYDFTIFLCPDTGWGGNDGLACIAINHSSDTRRCITTLYRSYSIDWDDFNGEEDYLPDVYLTDSGRYLSRGYDYEIIMDEPPHYGKNSYTIRGIGRYFGILDIGEGVLEEGMREDVWYTRGDERFMRFYASEDGLYKLAVCPSEEIIHTAAENGIALNSDLFDPMPSVSASVPGVYGMTYFKPASGQVSKGFSITEDLMSTVIEMKKGGKYSVTAGSEGNRYIITRRTVLGECRAEYTKSYEYGGEEIIPEITLYSPAGDRLIPDRDYTVRVWNNGGAGLMYAYVEGTGDYCGCLMLTMVIEGGNVTSWDGGGFRVIPDGEVFLSPLTEYKMVIEEDSYITLSNPGGSFTSLKITAEDGGFTLDVPRKASNRFIPAGTYDLITGSSQGNAVKYKLSLSHELKNIADSEISLKAPRYGTEDPPQAEVWHEGEALEYGTDYGIDVEKTEKQGIFCAYVWGKNGFGNEVPMEYVSYDTADVIFPVVSEGENIVAADYEITTADGLYKWFPDKSRYAFTVNDSYEQTYIIISDKFGRIITRGEVNRWSQLTCEVSPEEEYLVKISGSESGDIPLTITSTRRALGECTADYRSSAELGSPDEVVVFTDGERELTEGVDYIRLRDSGQIGIGTSEYVFEGIGDYYGTVHLPVRLYTTELPDEAINELTENFVTRIGGGEERPGIVGVLRFTAQHRGKAEYALSVMTTGVDRESGKHIAEEGIDRYRTRDAVPAEYSSVFIYDGDGRYMGTAEGTERLELEQDETRYIVVVTPYILDFEYAEREKELDVKMSYVRTIEDGPTLPVTTTAVTTAASSTETTAAETAASTSTTTSSATTATTSSAAAPVTTTTASTTTTVTTLVTSSAEIGMLPITGMAGIYTAIFEAAVLAVLFGGFAVIFGNVRDGSEE